MNLGEKQKSRVKESRNFWAKTYAPIRHAFSVTWPPALLLVALIGGLQWLTNAGVVKDFVLPAPDQVWAVLTTQFDLLTPHLVETLKVCLAGLFLSLLIGVALALLMDRIRPVRRACYPLVVASQTIPTLVITPVIVLIFGYGMAPKLVVVVLVSFFPICISFFQSLCAVDPDLIRLLRSMGASRNQTAIQVKIPASLPGLFSGLKISATYCVMAAALAEWSGGGDGLGIYMLRTKRSFTYDRMFAAIVVIVVLSLLIYAGVVLLEKICLPWVRAEQAQTRQVNRSAQLARF